MECSGIFVGLITREYQLFHKSKITLKNNLWFQAIKVSLEDIKPVNDDKWPEEVTKYMKTHLENKHVKILPFSKTEETYNVCMFYDMTNVNAHLVSKGFAESTGRQ